MNTGTSLKTDCAQPHRPGVKEVSGSRGHPYDRTLRHCWPLTRAMLRPWLRSVIAAPGMSSEAHRSLSSADPISNHRLGASQAATMLPRASQVFGIAGRSSESNTLIPPATWTSPRPLRHSTIPGSDMQSFSLRINEHRVNHHDLYGLVVERVQRPEGRPHLCAVSK